MRKTEIFAKLLNQVSVETEIAEERIISHERAAEVVDARYILVYLLLRNGFRASEIARMMGLSYRAVMQISALFNTRYNHSGITNKRVLLANNKQIALFLATKIGETLAR